MWAKPGVVTVAPVHTDPHDIGSGLIPPLDPHTIVLFGASGDLSRRKLLPGLFHLELAGLLPECRIVGTSLDDLDDDGFRAFARGALDEFARREVTDEAWEAFAASLRFVPTAAGPEGLAATVAAAEADLGGRPRRLHYLSVPPKAALAVVDLLAEADLVERSRIIMEKPFGTNLATAIALNEALHQTFTEDQIFRIDHFLGKEAALNILAFRFANGLFEPIWNRQHIDHVQIDVPETLSIGSRAPFYEATGAFRDMMVTHLFQVLAFMAMEPPTALEPKAIGEEKNKVFRSMSAIEPAHVVRGQYAGYLDEPGVSPQSETETFVALRCEIDNWRWAGVPFYLRTGKRLASRVSEIVVQFKPVPHSIFEPAAGIVHANQLVIRLQPDEGVKQWIMIKDPGPGGMRLRHVPLDMSFAQSFNVRHPDAYERLLMDVVRGNQTLFMRRDEVEAAWRWIDPIQQTWAERPDDVHGYTSGTWGPSSSIGLIERDGRTWHESI